MATLPAALQRVHVRMLACCLAFALPPTLLVDGRSNARGGHVYERQGASARADGPRNVVTGRLAEKTHAVGEGLCDDTVKQHSGCVDA